MVWHVLGGVSILGTHFDIFSRDITKGDRGAGEDKQVQFPAEGTDPFQALLDDHGMSKAQFQSLNAHLDEPIQIAFENISLDKCMHEEFKRLQVKKPHKVRVVKKGIYDIFLPTKYKSHIQGLP
jgi:hypothetical protein